MHKKLWGKKFAKPPWLPHWDRCPIRTRQDTDTGDRLCDTLRDFAAEERDRFFVLLVHEIARRMEMYGFLPPQPKKKTRSLSAPRNCWRTTKPNTFGHNTLETKSVFLPTINILKWNNFAGVQSELEKILFGFRTRVLAATERQRHRSA